MAPGTSPSIAGSPIAFTANTQSLWSIGAYGKGATGLLVCFGTSPSVAASYVTWCGTDDTGAVHDLYYSGPFQLGSTDSEIYEQGRPSMNANNVAFQNGNGDLEAFNLNTTQPSDTGLGMWGVPARVSMTAMTSRFTRTPDLWFDGEDIGVKMMPGTSPAIDDNDDIAFQGSNGRPAGQRDRRPP